jgi:hypothetical protein
MLVYFVRTLNFPNEIDRYLLPGEKNEVIMAKGKDNEAIAIGSFEAMCGVIAHAFIPETCLRRGASGWINGLLSSTLPLVIRKLAPGILSSRHS